MLKLRIIFLTVALIIATQLLSPIRPEAGPGSSDNSKSLIADVDSWKRSAPFWGFRNEAKGSLS